MEICFHCGREFEPDGEGWSDFCSDTCADAQRQKEIDEEVTR